ncbi:metalloregulator ArsR/SmtB family transcription factor [Streptomyces sp. NPDC021749]
MIVTLQGRSLSRPPDPADAGLSPPASLRTQEPAQGRPAPAGAPIGPRLAILRRLAEGEARVTDLVACVGLAQSTVSAHLSCLRDCGLITSRPQGRATLHALAHPELLDLLAAAEQLLAATGEAVDLCPTYGSHHAAPEESAR